MIALSVSQAHPGRKSRHFQQALHQDIPSVTVDGIVGPSTWQALVSGMLSL